MLGCGRTESARLAIEGFEAEFVKDLRVVLGECPDLHRDQAALLPATRANREIMWAV